jgi:uncharacterized FlaG/YvyC family protein
MLTGVVSRILVLHCSGSVQTLVSTLQSGKIAQKECKNDGPTQEAYEQLQTEHAVLQSKLEEMEKTHEALKAEHERVLRQLKLELHDSTGTASVWKQSTSCSQCARGFTIFNRRHHCRAVSYIQMRQIES